MGHELKDIHPVNWKEEEDLNFFFLLLSSLVVFPTVVAKGRSKKDNSMQTFVGNEVALADLFKMTLRSAYEGNAVCNVDALVGFHLLF